MEAMIIFITKQDKCPQLEEKNLGERYHLSPGNTHLYVKPIYLDMMIDEARSAVIDMFIFWYLDHLDIDSIDSSRCIIGLSG